MRPTTAKSFLFVPANRPERFLKAQNSGADAIIIDLEDTIADEQKTIARANVQTFDKHTNQPFWVRINPNHLLDDDLACLTHCQNIAGIILPKTESTAKISHIYQTLNLPIIAVIESPKGIHHLPSIASTEGILALSFGLLDLGKCLDVVPNSMGAWTIFNHLRSQLVIYSQLHQLARPIETIVSDFSQSHQLIRQATHAYQMGFGGQLCIHPNQVILVNHIYQPNQASQVFAQKVLSHHHQTKEVAFAIDGVMVDLPVIDWAKDLLHS